MTGTLLACGLSRLLRASKQSSPLASCLATSQVERPGVEILPPLGPRPALPLDEDEQEAQARLVDEWRERVARAWSMPPPGAAAQTAAGVSESEGGTEGADLGPAEDAAAQHDGFMPPLHSAASDDGGSGGASHSDSDFDGSSDSGASDSGSDCGGGSDHGGGSDFGGDCGDDCGGGADF